MPDLAHEVDEKLALVDERMDRLERDLRIAEERIATLRHAINATTAHLRSTDDRFPL